MLIDFFMGDYWPLWVKIFVGTMFLINLRLIFGAVFLGERL